jgi:hypothetical protein
MGKVDGRDYDPSRDHVCDRPDDSDEAGGVVVQGWPLHGLRGRLKGAWMEGPGRETAVGKASAQREEGR